MGKLAKDDSVQDILTEVQGVFKDTTAARMATALEKIAEAQGRVTITVTMTDGNGEAITGENIIVTNTVTGTQMYNIPYNGNPVDIQFNRDTVVNITGTQNTIKDTGWYAPSSTQILIASDTEVTITYKKMDTSKGFAAIKMVISENPGVEILPIGQTIVNIPYVADDGFEYQMPFALKSYGYFVKEKDKDTGKLSWGAKFQAIECGLQNIPFDVAETEAATETVADANLYYYGLAGETYTLLQIGKNGTGGELVPYDDYDTIYHNEIKDTGFNILRYGYNRYSHSAIDRYVESTAGTGEWWQASHIGDTKPSVANTTKGFAAGFLPEDLDSIDTVKWHCALNTVTEPDKTMVTEDIYRKFIIPSVVEMYSSTTDAELLKESTRDDAFWKFRGFTTPTDAADDRRKIYNIARATGTGGTTSKSAQSCRLRSANRGNSNLAWLCNSTGGLYSSSANFAYRCAPACVICESDNPTP